jgi:Bacterial PH domain
VTEYEEEPIRGLPGYLPSGEQIVWQGEPQWRALSRRVFHVRKVGIYFGVLMLVSGAQRISAGHAFAEVAGGMAWQLALGGVSVGILSLLAWLYARTTVYTITNRRVVMRFGVALPMMVNIPWDRIESAAFRNFADGNGDITLTPTAKGRVSYWTIWPHARPWRFNPVQPSLRGIDDAARVAALISSAVAGQTEAQPAREPQSAAWTPGSTATA